MFKDTKEGQTHSYNDGCGEPEHNIPPTADRTGDKGRTCTHHFEYVRQETLPIGSTTTNFKKVDVVICTKCGEVRRN